MSGFYIEMRSKQLINTDPQRRCYNGAHFSSESQWQPWQLLNSGISTKDEGERKLQFWRELNDYAVSQRGDDARSEFRLVGVI